MNVEAIRSAIDRDRLLDTAIQLIEVPSPTRSAAPAADRLAEILQQDGFHVERPEAGWAPSPAVVTRLVANNEGRTLQFSGHLDTVHLPFIPPRVDGDILYGSGASDMKGGLAAAVEAMRALRDADALPAGSILLTAYDLHEAPWGDSSQLRVLIDSGFVGDAVLVPEYLCDRLPVVGRGMAILRIRVTRPGEPVHEVVGGFEQPSVIAAGAEVIQRFGELNIQLAQRTHPLAGRETLFVGQIHAGEIYNQAPTELRLDGTRRWLPGTSVEDVRTQYAEILADVAERNRVSVKGDFQLCSDAYEIGTDEPLVEVFQSAYETVTGQQLEFGAKPFVDDGSRFVLQGGIPAVTHGPRAKGAHTLDEEVPIKELLRVALVYALAACSFCNIR